MGVELDQHGVDTSELGPEVVAEGSLNLSGGGTKEVDTGVTGPVFAAVSTDNDSPEYDGVVEVRYKESATSYNMVVIFRETSGSTSISAEKLLYTIYQF